ncbi:MAG: DEAD/DEAH box helicase [archaeon]|nr:DEAD/DEAH box helicase [archaeon]
MEIIELVKHHNGFDSFNPMQKKAIDAGVLEKSIVVSSPTASGKTVVAELASLNSILKNRKKVVYTCPLRALASEHSNDFKNKYSAELGIKTVLSTGDFDSAGKYLSQKDIIFTTYEKLNSLLNHRADWLSQIGLLVVDEIHSIGSDRGATLEMLITKLRFLNKNIQVLGLSATIPNAKDLSKWLGAELVESDYRPVELKEGVFLDDKIDFGETSQDVTLSTDPTISICLDTLKKGKQALVFSNTKRSSEATAKKLANITEKVLTEKEKNVLNDSAEKVLSVLEQPTVQCRTIAELIKKGSCFHNAGLLQKQREIVEDLFRRNYLKFIASTPTLAAGVNLPAYRVILQTPYRYTGYGMDRIPVSEWKQMAGRCVSGDTVVYTNNGVKRVEEIFSRFFGSDEVGKKEADGKLELLGVELETGSVKIFSVRSLWKRKAQELIEIETRGGKRIRVTPEHPMLCFTKIAAGKPRISPFSNAQELYAESFRLRNEQGFGPTKAAMVLGVPEKSRQLQHWFYDGSKPFPNPYEWREAQSLEVGETHKVSDYLSCPVAFSVMGEVSAPIEYVSSEKFVRKEDLLMNKTGHQAHKFPLEWSVNLCRFIAKIMSDGSIYYNKKDNSYLIRYYNKNRGVQEEYSSMVYSLFGKKTKAKWRRGSYCCGFKSLPIGDFLANLGVPSGKKAFILKLPEVLFYLPDEMAKAFVKEYSDCDGWETGNSYFLITSSERLARDFCLMFSKLGWIPRICRKKPNSFRQSHIWEVSVTKSQFNGVSNKNMVGQVCPDQIKCMRKILVDEYVYDFTLETGHNFIANGLVIHNSGRPKYDSEGQAILLAKTEFEKDDYFDYFINGEIENMDSKLASETALRFHLLAVISTGFVFDLESAEKFFSQTFYAAQTGNLSSLFRKIISIVKELEEMGFVDADENRIDATPLGKRVTELYLDPMSAFSIITSLKQNKFNDLAYLFTITNTSEFTPLVSSPASKEAELWEQLQENKELLPINADVEMFTDNNILSKLWTSFLLKDWVEEVKEQDLVDSFKVQPGILRAKLQNADWLAYSALELAKIIGLQEHFSPLNKMRKRLKNGIKEELVMLCELRGIGRVRARRLFNSGIKSISDVKKIDVKDLEKILSPKIAISVKQQLLMKK